MKYKFFTLLFIILSISAFGQKKFLIEGKIGELSSPATLYLFYDDPVTNRPVRDSVLLDKGKFTFEGTIDYPVYAKMIYSFNGNIRYATAADERKFYIDEGKIIINGRQLFNADIKGSKTQDLLTEYFAIVNPIQEKIIKIRNDRDDIYKPYSPEFRDSLDYQLYKLDKEYNRLSMDFVEAHLYSMLAVDMLSSENKAHPENDQVEILFGRLSEEIKNSAPGKRLKRDIRNKKRIGPGHISPNFAAKTLDGELKSLSEYKGKWVLLVFWSPTCDICRNEALRLKEIYAKYKNKGFEIIAFTIEETENKHEWEKAVTSLKIPYTTLSDLKAWSSPIVQQYKIDAVPENYLINPDGLINAIDLYDYNLEKVLQRVLK